MRSARTDVNHLKARRDRLAKMIPGGAMVLPAWPEFIRNADTHHNYRAESNLYYLTGFEEPQSCLIFRPGKTPETVLFVRPKDVTRETWDGFRFGPEGTKQTFGVDQTYLIDDFTKEAPALLRDCEKVFYTMFKNPEFDRVFANVLDRARHRYSGLLPVEDAYAVVGELRLHKTAEEAEFMRAAGRISAEGHIEMMKATRPGQTERTLHGIFLKSVMERGADGEAYGGIVAGGTSATTLHYRWNDATLRDGDVVLVDCGAEYQLYSGDITRTWPVNGKFTPVQKRIYEKILKVQMDLIDMVKPGLIFSDLQKFTTAALTQILIEEKVLKGSVDENIKKSAHSPYYMHGVSHMLGLDTHDAGNLIVNGQSRRIAEGWVLTIEPGLYFPVNDTSIPAELRGLGIRIEDDILVTATGSEVLTAAVPKDVEGMEALIG